MTVGDDRTADREMIEESVPYAGDEQVNVSPTGPARPDRECTSFFY